MSLVRMAKTALIGFVLTLVLMPIGVVGGGLWLASPRHIAIRTPPSELGAQSVEVATQQGAVHGWLITGRPGLGVVVLMHGLHANRLSMVRRAAELSRRGFSVLLFDFQAHGESPGRWITFGQQEAVDARAAVDFVRQRFPGERVGVIGSSLGGAAALLGNEPLPVDAMVLESVYPNIHDALANRLKVVAGPAGPLFVPIFELMVPPLIGLRVEDLRPEEHVRAVKCPKLIIAGTDDDRTPMNETRRLFDAASEPKQLWAVEGAHHVDLEAYGPSAYWGHVLPFLVQALNTQNGVRD